MAETFIVEEEVHIDAPPAKVWQALTDPALVKEYLFGTEVASDWKEGSPITYRGEWQGKAYEDKGRILKVEPEKMLVSTYWSSMSGTPDAPENYKTVSYELVGEGEGTLLTLTQDNCRTREEAEHSRKNWRTVLDKMKALLEAPRS